MLIPVIIEPVNKMWHLGSYAFFPLRFGFIPIFLILVMGMYAISLQSEKKDDKRKNNIVLSLSTLGVTTIILIFSTVYFYEDIQRLLDGLTISENKVLALVLYGQALLVFLSALWIYFKNNRYQNYTWLLLLILAIVHIESNAFLHIGMDFDQERLMSQYQNMNALYENEKLDHTYGLKTLDTDLFDNYGAVSSFKTIGHFTSLTNRDAIRLGKRLGYNSTWMKMSSYGANPLVDYLLGNRYMLSKTSVEKPFYKAIDKIGDYYVYESILPMSHGYMIEQDFNLTEAKNSFDATNMIYQALTGKEDTIFSIIDQDAFQLQNLEKKMNSYTKINKENDGTITPCGAAGSIVFTPEYSIRALENYYNNFPKLWGKYGFKDAYNLEDEEWYSKEYIGIDKGISMIMIENYLSELIWKYFMKNEYVQKGLDILGIKNE